MNFIKKIVDKGVDNSVHLQFQKFSKGEFRDRALVNAKKTGKKYTLSTTPEFANELVREIANELGNSKTNVKGAIVSTSDLKNDIEYENIKQFQGVKRYLINSDMSGEDIIKLLDEFPKAFFALSFSSDASTLKIKPKAPKSGKPSSKGEAKPKPDFCKLTTTNEDTGKNFIFEVPDFKKAEINHTFVIEQIIVPDELRGSEDFAKIREESKRKGRILRHALIDEKEYERVIEFEA